MSDLDASVDRVTIDRSTRSAAVRLLDSSTSEVGWAELGGHVSFVSLRVPAGTVERIVVCFNGVGIEAQGASATFDLLEEMLATDGAVVARFDPPNTGNAPGATAGVRWTDWTESGASLLQGLADRWPGRPVHVFSMQVGVAAAIAALGQAESQWSNGQRGPLESLIAWAPIVAGSRFLRATKMLAAAETARKGTPPAKAAAPEASDLLEAGGYEFGPGLVQSIGAIDLTSNAVPASASVLVIDRDDMPSANAWVESIRNSQPTNLCITASAVPGFRDARVDDPESGIAAQLVCEHIKQFVAQDALHRSGEFPPENANGVRLYSRVTLERPSVRVIEEVRRVVSTGSDGAPDGCILVFVAKPASDNPSLRRHDRGEGSTVVLLPTGSNTLGGPGRLHTDLGRSIAGDGHIAIRYDRRGVFHSFGEFSPNPELDPRSYSSLSYAREHHDDLAAIISHAADVDVAREVTLVGTCSGATIAYRFALSGRSRIRIRTLVTLNQILWDRDRADVTVESPLIDSKVTAKLVAALRQPSQWPNLLRSEANLRVNLRRVSRHVLAASRKRQTFGSTGPHPFERLASSGIDQIQVFDSEEVGQHFLRETSGSVLDALRKRGALDTWTLSGAGHTFGPSWSKRWLDDRLRRLLATS